MGMFDVALPVLVVHLGLIARTRSPRGAYHREQRDRHSRYTLTIGIAHQLHLAPEPFVLAVLLAANMGFIFPTETNLLILNAGTLPLRGFREGRHHR